GGKQQTTVGRNNGTTIITRRRTLSRSRHNILRHHSRCSRPPCLSFQIPTRALGLPSSWHLLQAHRGSSPNAPSVLRNVGDLCASAPSVRSSRPFSNGRNAGCTSRGPPRQSDEYSLRFLQHLLAEVRSSQLPPRWLGPWA